MTATATRLRSEADVMRTLTTGTRTLAELYQYCQDRTDVSRDGGLDPIPGHPTDLRWNRRVRGVLANMHAAGRAHHVDRTIWAIHGTPARPTRLTLVVAGATPLEFEISLASAVDTLRQLGRPADLVFADPPWGIRRGEDPRFTGGHGYRRDHTRVVPGYVDVPARRYAEFTAHWVQAAAEALRPGGQLAIITGPQQSAIVQVAAEQAGLTWVTSIVAKKNFPLATTRRPSCAHWRVTVLCRGPLRSKRRVFNPPTDQPTAKSGHPYPLDWWVNNGTAARRGDLLRYDNALPQRLVNRTITSFSDPGDHVVEPFLGGGTGMIGCWDTGRDFTGGDANLEAVRFAGARLLTEHAWPAERQPSLWPSPAEQAAAQLDLPETCEAS